MLYTKEAMDKLAPLDLKKIVIGANLDTEIYYRYKDEIVMLCKNIEVTETVLGTFFSVSISHGDLYINKDLYPEYQKAAHKKWFANITDKQYFEELEQITKELDENIVQSQGMFEDVTATDEIDTEIMKDITSNVQEILNDKSQDAVFAYLNQLKDVNTYLYKHSVNVATLNGLIGKWIGLDEVNCRKLIETGLLHDIGMVKIDSNILNKPTKLLPQEFEMVKKHPIYSYEIAKKSGVRDLNILHGIRSHHERMTGTGYPDGLTGTEIPLFAKITAISDVYDAMISKRCYKDPVSPFKVLAEFARDKYSDLDIKYVNIFLDVAARILVGQEIILNDGRQATVLFIRNDNYEYPIVRVEGEVIQTNQNLYCKELYEPDDTK